MTRDEFIAELMKLPPGQKIVVHDWLGDNYIPYLIPSNSDTTGNTTLIACKELHE